MFRFKILLLMVSILLLNNKIYSQDVALKPAERIEAAKKIRLLEILNLNESDADKMLVRYTALERTIREKKEAFMSINDELIEYIEKYPNGKELSDKTNKVIKAQKELHSAVEDKLSGMKQILNDENFAKFVAFEIKFSKRMRNAIMDREFPGDLGPDGEMPPRRKGKRK